MREFRAISIRSYITKIHHSFVRGLFRLLVGSAVTAFQFGGTKGLSHLMASAMLRWTISAAIQAGQSCQVFLGDVQSAYYKVLHSLLTPRRFSRDTLNDVLDDSDIPLSFHGPLLDMLEQPGAIAAVTHDEHVLAMMEESISNSWFATRQGGQVCEPRSGSGPGGPLADTWYTFAIAPIYHQVELWLVNEGMQLRFPHLPPGIAHALGLDPSDTSIVPTQSLYCDDNGIVAVLSNKHDIPEQLVVIPRFVRHVYWKRGLSFNWAPEKSAIVPMISGQAKVDR